MFVNPPRDQAAQGYGLVDLLAGNGLDDRVVDGTEDVHCDGGVDRVAASEVPRAAGLQRHVDHEVQVDGSVDRAVARNRDLIDQGDVLGGGRVDREAGGAHEPGGGLVNRGVGRV